MEDQINHLLHILWGKAHDGPDYNKDEWIEFQRLIEELQKGDKDAIDT